MTRVEEIIEEESEDDFEIISNHEEEQEEVEEQEPQQEDEEEQPEEVEREIEREEQEQPPPEVVREGRKIYITKTGIKYHLTQGCDNLKGYRSYERRACERCSERTQEILDINPNGSPPQSETELTFVYAAECYHHKDCEVIRHNRRKGSKPICYPCESEERMFLWSPEARGRGTGTIIQR